MNPIEIARCKVLTNALTDPSFSTPCRALISYQQRCGYSTHQIPEPWNGNIASAPLLFVASNPAISPDEHYPTLEWSDAEIVQFFQGRFGDGMPRTRQHAPDEPIRNGIYVRRADGGYDSRWSRFLASIRARAAELGLLRPGTDYAVTEVVHCKSPSESSKQDGAMVANARDHCVDLHFEKVLLHAGARVIVFLGDHARRAAVRKLGVNPVEGACALEPMDIAGRQRVLIFLHHPSARLKGRSKALNAQLGLDIVGRIRTFLAAEKSL